MESASALARETWLERTMSDERPETLTTTEARAGATPHMTRYVLGISLVLVVLLFAIIYLVAAT
jgi:hypothetical protein